MYRLLASKFKFLTVILSTFALLHLQIGVVYAQVENDEIAQQRIQQSQGPQSSASQNRTQQKASVTKDVKLDETSAGISDMIYFLVLIGMSLFVASLWRFQPMPWDMRIAMGAAVVMLGSEIISVFGTRAKIDAGTYHLTVEEDGTVNNLQVDALRKQRESYQHLKKHGELKWKIQAAGAAAYTVAGSMALMLGAKVQTLHATCLTALAANNCPAAQSLHSAENTLFMTPQESEIKAPELATLKQGMEAALTQCIGYPPTLLAPAAVTAATTGCTPYIASMKEEPVAVAPDGNLADIGSFLDKSYRNLNSPTDLLFSAESLYVLKNHLPDFLKKENDQLDFLGLSDDFFIITTTSRRNNMSSSESYSDLFLNFLLPQANAFTISQLGLSASVIIIFIAVYKKGFVWMNKLMINPNHRAKVYFAVAAASGIAMMITRKSVSQAEDNIKKIDDMLDRLGRLQKMKVANLENQIQSAGIAGRLDPQDFAGTRIADNGRKFPCPPTVGRVSSGCPSIEKDIKSSPGIGDFGSVMGNLATLSGRVADGFTGNSELSAGTINDIESLSSNLGVARRMARQVQDQINDNNKRLGLKPIDFQKEQDELLNSIASGIQEDFRNGVLSKEQIAAAFGGDLPISTADTSSSQEEMKMETSTVASKGGANMNNVKAPSFDFTFGDDGFSDAVLEDDFNYSDDMYAKAFDNISTSGSGGTSQIVGNRDVSLFQVISVRYMKSGLPRLLQEIE